MITDLNQVDLLYTRTTRDLNAGTVTLQVRSGPQVLAQRVLTNTSQTLPDEINIVLKNMIDDVIRGESPRLNDSGLLVDSSGNPLNIGGSSGSGSNIATWFAGSTVTTSNFQSSFGGVGQTVDNFGTTHVLKEMQGHFTEVRLIFANGSNTFDIHIGGAAVAVAPNVSDVKLDAVFASEATAPKVTFNGSDRGIVPKRNAAVTGNGPNILMSDWTPISSVERDDVIGGKPLLAVRVAFDGRKDVTITGGGRSDPFSGWLRGGSKWATGSVAGPAGLMYTARPWGNFLRTALAGSFSTPELAVNSGAGQAPLCALFGIQYRTKNKSVTLFFTGDSIVSNDYAGAIDRSFGWANESAYAASTLERPVEYCNMGIAAQTSTTFGNYGRFAADLIRPTHIVHWGLTPNDLSNGVGAPQITLDQLATMNANTTLMRNLATTIGAKFVIVSGVPRNQNATTSYFDATNGLAVERYRNSLRSFGAPYIDLLSAVANKGSFGYRFQMVAAGDEVDLTTDFIHPNPAGRAIMVDAAKPAILAVVNAALPVAG